MTTLKDQISAAFKEFDEKWEEATFADGTVDKENIRHFLSQALDKASRAAIEACVPPKSIIDEKVFPFTRFEKTWDEADGWNAARTEMKSLADKYMGV